jgi:hypothetical protein
MMNASDLGLYATGKKIAEACELVDDLISMIKGGECEYGPACGSQNCGLLGIVSDNFQNADALVCRLRTLTEAIAAPKVEQLAQGNAQAQALYERHRLRD